MGADSHEANYGNHLDDGEYELGFSVALYSKEVDDDNDEEKYRDENGLAYSVIPIRYGYRSSDDLKRQHHHPLERVTRMQLV
jgi:hypothetical protein